MELRADRVLVPGERLGLLHPPVHLVPETVPGALTEDLEYRFIGERLALVDAHAHIIVDFTNDVLP